MAWVQSAGVNEALDSITVEASVADTCLRSISIVGAGGVNVTWVRGSADIDMTSGRIVPGGTFT